MKTFGWFKMLLISFFGAVLVLILGKVQPLSSLDNRHADFLTTNYSDTLEPNKDIVVVLINENMLATLPYRSPLDRGMLFDLVSKLLAAKPKAIGLDILFDQSSEPDKDSRLFELFKEHSEKVVVAYADITDGLSEQQQAFEDQYLQDISKAIVVLAQNKADGVVRHYLTQRETNNKPMLVMGRKLAGVTNGRQSNYERIIYQPPTKELPRSYVNYPAHILRALPVLPAPWFKDKYILIGVDLPYTDRYRTPFVAGSGPQGKIPGVLIHAHILDQVLAQASIKEFGLGWQFILSWLAGLLGIFCLILPYNGWLKGLFTVVSVGALFGISAWAFSSLSWLLPFVATLASLLFSMLFGAALLWKTDRKEKQFIYSAWQQYVNPEVVKDLVRHPEKLKPGGEVKELSFIFTDIEGFTSLTENMPVETLSLLLNDYLDRVSAQFFSAGATLDKFVGDAVVGFIGAPFHDEDHANKAVKLALTLDKVCQEFVKEQKQKGLKFGRTRIGVHTGMAIVGNFGGTQFFDYTALGDTVNTASRLEGANKAFNSHVCVSGKTVEHAGDFEFRPMGELFLAGKSNRVYAWEPVQAMSDKCAPLKKYLNAYDILKTGEANAKQAFKELAMHYPNDYAVMCHMERINNGANDTIIDRRKVK